MRKSIKLVGKILISAFAVVGLTLSLLWGSMYLYNSGYERGATDVAVNAGNFFMDACNRNVPIIMPDGNTYICRRSGKL